MEKYVCFLTNMKMNLVCVLEIHSQHFYVASALTFKSYVKLFIFNFVIIKTSFLWFYVVNFCFSSLISHLIYFTYFLGSLKNLWKFSEIFSRNFAERYPRKAFYDIGDNVPDVHGLQVQWTGIKPSINENCGTRVAETQLACYDQGVMESVHLHHKGGAEHE